MSDQPKIFTYDELKEQLRQRRLEVLRMWNEGKKQVEIAAIMGVKKQRIQAILKREGYVSKRRHLVAMKAAIDAVKGAGDETL